MSTPSNRTGGAATKAEGPRGTPGRPEPRTSERPSQRPGGPESLVGRILSGRYLIERVIGEGGMGAVYQAEHTHMHKRLAVKVLHPEMSRLSEVVARFEREAMAAAHIEHPNVAAATDFGKLDDGSFFLVLEYVEGKSLREAIAAGRLELGRAIHVTRQIASALSRAHALGIVHRDLKPENVMLVQREDDASFVKVLDFGIAKVPVGSLIGEHKVAGQALTQLGMVYGTPEYMAPEQALGQAVDLRADLYALGAMAFEMITGHRPFDHESKVTLLGMHVTAPIPRMSERAPDANIPPEIEAVITRLLSKEATARHQDAKELIEELDTVATLLAERGRISDPFPAQSAVVARRASMADSGPRSAMATNPTVSAQHQGMASLVGASVGNGLKAWSPWTPRKIAAVIAAAVGAVGLVVVGVVVLGSMHEGPAPSSLSTMPSGVPTGSTSPPPPPPPDPSADAVVSAAQGKIEKGDFATATDELLAIEKSDPQRADVHMLLERAYTGVRNTPAAMHEVGLWLAADPGAVTDIHLQEDVRNAALVHETQDEAFSLLETKMGMRGIDIVFDIAYGASGRGYPQAAARARHELDMPDVRKRASPALATLIAFREAKTCDQKHALLDAVRDKGDARLVSELKPYESTRGCGFLGRSDCAPCMHRDHLLEEAKQAILERVKAQQ
jgi:serine/threonine protein kinase